MRALLFATLLAACSCNHQTKTAREPTPGGAELVVMTFNVNFGIGGDPDTLDLIRNSDADVILLQESTPEWEAALRRELGARYPHMKFNSPTDWPAGGSAVLSKRPFQDKELIPSPVGWFPGWRIVAETPIGDVQILSVHLRPPLSEPNSLAQGYFSTKADRQKEIETYFARLDGDLPTLVVGDFNEDEDGRAVRFLASRGLKSALPQFAPAQKTWHWNTSVGEIHDRLDHVVYDEDRLEPTGVRVLEAGNSDHYPVIARFERRK